MFRLLTVVVMSTLLMAREGGWLLGSFGALLGGVIGYLAAGAASIQDPAAYVTAGFAIGGTLGGAAGGLLGWGTHEWKPIWKVGHSIE